MNHTHRIAIPVCLLFCVVLIVLFAYRVNMSRTIQTLRPTTVQTTNPETTPTPIKDESDQTLYKDLIEIIFPLPNSVITLGISKTTLEVKGRARGTWFFEASFPVQLVNESGDVIATGIAQADGAWMTTEFVPFSSTLTCNATKDKTGNIGALVLKKDNSSGDPANEDTFVIPIQFE